MSNAEFDFASLCTVDSHAILHADDGPYTLELRDEDAEDSPIVFKDKFGIVQLQMPRENFEAFRERKKEGTT